jgi:alkylation response protein AidB-like acyl-CoA dehydrogenase
LLPAETPGLLVRGHPAIDGGRVAELTLDGVVLGRDALLGLEGQGHATLERSIGRGVLALCAEALGAMEAAKDATLDHLRTRKQFGTPIGSFQALQHRMAEMLIEIEQARSAVINAAVAIQADRLTRERALSAAKFSIGRIGTLVAEECIQMHGGIGITCSASLPWVATERLSAIAARTDGLAAPLPNHPGRSRSRPAALRHQATRMRTGFGAAAG